jgi:small conductance mechanosensitive channel
MKHLKKIILFVVLAALMLLLVNPNWIPFLDESTKLAVASQLQDTFGGLFGGVGMLTPARLISAAVVLLMMGLVCIVVCWLLELLAKTGKQRQSISGLFISLTKFLCVMVGLVWALSILGVNLMGIFASLGIASLIVGFGAQSLIEDAITGIFMIFEGQYNVGDIIVLDDFRGVVRKIGIRTTSVEDAGGNYKIVNNSDIRNVQNRSKNRSVAVCDLCVSYDADIRELEKILIPALDGIYEQRKELFLSKPTYAGVESLGESSVVLRFVVEVTEENFFSGRRALTRDLKIVMDENNLEIPFNQLVVHQADK